MTIYLTERLSVLSAIFTAAMDFVYASVSGGFVVALAVICLLQYVVHLHRMLLARRERDRFHQELSEVGMQLIAARRDRSLTTQENHLLREFLGEADCERALRGVLQRLLSTDDDFAVCVRYRSAGWCIEHSVGLATAAARRLEIDEVFHSRLVAGEPVVLAGELLYASRLWATLPPENRNATRELYVFGIAGQDDLPGAFVSTGLLAPAGDWPRQLESTARVLSSVAGSLRDRWRLESRQDELHSKDELLALRSIADRHFDSPLQMIDEFVGQAAVKVGASRAVLFLAGRNSPPRFRAMVRCGESLPDSSKEVWYRQEESLASAAAGLTGPSHFGESDLRRLGVDGPLGAALLVPVAQHDRMIGLLLFSRGATGDFSPAQQRLAGWSGALLAELFPRVVNQAVVARQARIDSLTQLANRGSFDREFVQELQACRQAGVPLSLLLLDLDRFKSINDRYGHRAGDAVLRAVAALVRDSVQNIRLVDRLTGASPFVARYGGEELAVLLPRLDLVAARRIAESIRAAVSAARIGFDGEPIAVTTSGGIAAFPEHGDSADGLIAAADAALYLAKSNGRNRIEEAEPALSPSG